MAKRYYRGFETGLDGKLSHFTQELLNPPANAQSYVPVRQVAGTNFGPRY